MNSLSQVFWRGLATVLPVAITIAVVYWVGYSLEAMLGGILKLMLPPSYYLPGTGLVVALAVILVVGLFMRAWVVRQLVGFGESLIERIPLAKTIYSSVRDITSYFSMMATDRNLGKAVVVDLGNGCNVLGFLTSEDMPFIEEDESMVAVFLPMSYQLGGYTVCLPAHQVRGVNLSSEAAMRWVLTAGVTARSEGDKPPKKTSD